MKSSLKKALGRRRLSRQELETLLHEIECCVNARPLTFVGDTLDSGRPLTPSHFLLGRSSPYTKVDVNLNMPPSDPVELLESQEELLKEFWYIWKQEYLRNLPPFRGKGPGREIGKGSVVLIENEGARITWPLGVVLKMFPGRDGLSRTVEVKTEKGVYVRPIQRLHSLEIDSPALDQTENPHSDTLSDKCKITPSDGPRSGRKQEQTNIVGCGDQLNITSNLPDLAQRTRSGRAVRAREVLDL